MVNHRFVLSFVVTSFAYIAVGYSLLYFSKTTTISDKQSPLKTIELSIQAFQPQVVEKKPEPIKEETPPPVEKEPEPVKEEMPPLPEPKVEKPKPLEPPKPKPLVKKEKLKKPEVKKKKPKKVVKKTKKRRPPTQKRNALKSTKKQHSTAKQKNLFLAKVRDRINRHKSYPRIAKRRGIQGSVRVDFTILPNGHVSAIEVKGPRAFHSSAKRAVEKAFPVSVKNIPMKLPEKVSITLHYKLRR